MLKLFWILLVFLLPAFSDISAEKREIPLPQLNGYYSSEGIYYRVATIEIDTIPHSICDVYLKLSGIVYSGSFCVDGLCGPWCMVLTSLIPDSTTCALWEAKSYICPYHVCPGCSDNFSIELPFVVSDGDTWDFLALGSLEIALEGIPMELRTPNLFPHFKPSADIESAVLVIVTEEGTSLKLSTWGSIKSKFLK